MTFSMVKVKQSGQMDLAMLVTIMKARDKALELTRGLTIINIVGNGQTTPWKALEHMNGLMEENMKVIGQTI